MHAFAHGPSRRAARFVTLAITLAAGLVAAPTQAAASTTPAPTCQPTKLPFHYQAAAPKPPITWCVALGKTPGTMIDAQVAMTRSLLAGKGGSAKLERRTPFLSRKKEKALAASREQQVRAAATGKATRAAVTGGGGPISAPPGGAGIGSHSEGSESQTTQDAEHATVKTTHTSTSRFEFFGPACPDANGVVVVKIDMDITDVRSSERRGKRSSLTTDVHLQGTLTGSFTDAFELAGPLKLDEDFTMETRGETTIAATGKVIGKDVIESNTVSLSSQFDGAQALGGIEGIREAADNTTVSGGGPSWGEHGESYLVNSSSFALTLMAMNWISRTEARIAFAATISNAVEYRCVTADATPSGLTLKKGESGTFAIVARGLDDHQPLPTVSSSRVYSGNMHLDPEATKIPGPASGSIFTVTSGGGKGVLDVSSATRRGYAPSVKVPVDEPPTPKPFVAPSFSGTFSGDADLSTIPSAPINLHATFDGSFVIAPDPPTPGFALPGGAAMPGVTTKVFYHLTSGSVHVHYGGVEPNGCTLLADGTVDLMSDLTTQTASAMTLSVGPPVTVSLLLPAPMLSTIPGSYTNCPDPSQDKSLAWPVTTGIAALISAPPDQPLSPTGGLSGTTTGRIDPSNPLQTWTWNLVPVA